MDNLESLGELLAKVEIGVCDHGSFIVMDKPKDGIRAHHAYNGSLDAAKSLMQDALQGWVTHTINWKWGDCVEVTLFEVSPEMWHEKGMGKSLGVNSCPARAWLIAIIKALIAKETP